MAPEHGLWITLGIVACLVLVVWMLGRILKNDYTLRGRVDALEREVSVNRDALIELQKQVRGLA